MNIISKNEIDLDDFYHEIGFPSERIHVLEKNDKKNLFKTFKSTLYKLNPEVVLNWSIQTALWTFLTNIAFKNKTVINCTIRGGTHYDSLKYRSLSKLAVKLSKFNIANSKAGLSLFGLKKNSKNTVIYNAFLEPNNHDNISVSLDQVFGKKLDKSDIVIANIGGLYKHKNQMSLIQAIKALNDKRYHLMIIGEGSERKNLEKYVSKHGLTEQIVLLGRKEQVFPYLKESDMYVNTSSGEGCSNAIVEAMHFGLPVISTPDGGTTEIAFPSTTQYFEFNNIEELADCIRNAPKKQDIDQTKLNQWLQKFDLESCLDNYENFIKKTAC